MQGVSTLNNRSNTTTLIGTGLLAMIAALLAMLVFQNTRRGEPSQQVEFDSSYQAVLLDNGLVYFGKIEKMGSRYLEMSDVHYVQSGIEEKTKKQTNVLLKRGKEWHGPDRMVINVDHIVFIEPVDRDSKVAELIEALKRQ